MLSGPAEDELLRPFPSFDLASRRSVVAAVSGGGDSIALLILLKTHFDQVASGAKLLAVTVDHGLRPGSDAEALGVARLCASHGIAHRTLRWTGPKPSTGIAAAAREARYMLLSQAADETGADLVLTGHTADDQAETVLMRAARDKGRGVAGIAPATLYDGRIWIVRPLLGTKREKLRDFLRGREISWIDDPTNADEAYERPKMRSQLRGDCARTDAALRDAGEAAGRRKTLGEAAALLIGNYADRPSPGLLRLDRAFVDASEPQAAIYALRILLACAGGTPFLPDEARTAALHGRLAAGQCRAVLSRALIDARRGGIFLLREARDLPAPAQVFDGMIWDGRYKVSAPGNPVGAAIAARGPEHARRAELSHAGAPESLARAALAGEPSASGPARLAPVLAPWARFLPSFDLAPARAVAGLLGAAEIPAPPFRSHIERNA